MNHIVKEDQTNLLKFFRRGVRHVATQGEKSMRDPNDPDDPGQCSYHHYPSDGGGALRCAIGGGVRLDVAEVLELKFSGEGITWDSNLHELEEVVCKAIGISCNEQNIKFLERFQGCHDGACDSRFVKSFLCQVQNLADDYDIAFDREQYA